MHRYSLGFVTVGFFLRVRILESCIAVFLYADLACKNKILSVTLVLFAFEIQVLTGFLMPVAVKTFG